MLKRVIVLLSVLAFSFVYRTSADEVFFVNQCRVLDTRALGGPRPAGVEFGFKTRGQVGHLQGGSLNCGVPIEATGVIVNVTVIPVGSGFLRVYAPGQPAQDTSRLNYTFSGVVVSNEMNVGMTPHSTTSNDVVIVPAISATHLIGDIVAYTAESNPTFPIILGRVFGEPFQAFGRTHVKVETAPGNNCTDPNTCFEVECSPQPGAEEVCSVSSDNSCIEIQGYRRPYSSPQYQPSQRLVGTIVRLFGFPPCPWE